MNETKKSKSKGKSKSNNKSLSKEGNDKQTKKK